MPCMLEGAAVFTKPAPMCYTYDAGGDNEVQRTMLEIVNQLDGFDSRGNIKVLMATNRPDTLDPALLRPGRLDRKVSALHCNTHTEFTTLLSLYIFLQHDFKLVVHHTSAICVCHVG